MRKLVVSLALAGAALAVAAPASAQYYPAPPPPPPYGYGNGYAGNAFGEVRALQFRLNAIESQIGRLDRRDVIRDRSADRLRNDARQIERRLHRAERFGLNPYEVNDIQARISNLEQRVRYAVGNGYGRGRYGGYDRY